MQKEVFFSGLHLRRFGVPPAAVCGSTCDSLVFYLQQFAVPPATVSVVGCYYLPLSGWRCGVGVSGIC